MKAYSAQFFRTIVKELSLPLFFGVPVVETLSDQIGCELFNDNVKWNSLTSLLYRALMLRYWLYPLRSKNSEQIFPEGQIFVTWMDGTPRITDLVLPVLKQLKKIHSCVVLCGNPNVSQYVPYDLPCVAWDHVLSFDVNDWRVEYKQCNKEWAVKIKSICRQYELPIGAVEALQFWLMISSQQVMGCISFLKSARPRVILTDYDRNSKWSCLVLAARLLGISTVTLVHGDMGKDAVACSPVIADKIVCWGELGREKLISAGEPAQKIFIGGCPRLSRNLSATPAVSRMKLLLDPLKPAVMYTATNDEQNMKLVESFCQALEKLDFVSGFVRLHPAEKLSLYSDMIDKHPTVKFFESNIASLDESIASAEAVVFHSSNMGNDVLAKRLPLVLLDFNEYPSGLGCDVVTLAGCPHVRTSHELADVLSKILLDDSFRRKQVLAAEPYVESFCCAYGEESARLTADFIRRQVVCP